MIPIKFHAICTTLICLITCFGFFRLEASDQSKIVTIDKIEEVETSSDALILFNIAEVLMDTETSLGTQAWRKYVRSRVDSKLHDALSLYVFKHVPPKSPEPAIPELIQKLQAQGAPVFAFTSRGRGEWYKTKIPGVDQLTEEMLKKIGIDFSKTALPSELAQIDLLFSAYYHEGIVYTTNSVDKGELLTALLEKTGYNPRQIIFVDDKADSLKSVAIAAEKKGIAFKGYAYTRTSKDHKDFDPMIAHIQLDWLLSHNTLLSDAQAAEIKAKDHSETNHEAYFLQLIEKWQAQQIGSLEG